MPERADPYAGYDVLAKRDTPSWNAQTRRVVEARMAVRDVPQFFTAEEFATVQEIAARLVPQPPGRPRVPVAGLVDRKLGNSSGDGFRHAGMPREAEAWRRGLQALDAEAEAAHGMPFRHLLPARQEALLRAMAAGALKHGAWGTMPPAAFFRHRLGRDIVHAYYAHPYAWNEIGFGGPAGPRGYVRTGFDRSDPWEARERHGR